jgi:hypothetical protein
VKPAQPLAVIASSARTELLVPYAKLGIQIRPAILASKDTFCWLASALPVAPLMFIALSAPIVPVQCAKSAIKATRAIYA